jgi:hypothetical protein
MPPIVTQAARDGSNRSAPCTLGYCRLSALGSEPPSRRARPVDVIHERIHRTQSTPQSKRKPTRGLRGDVISRRRLSRAVAGRRSTPPQPPGFGVVGDLSDARGPRARVIPSLLDRARLAGPRSGRFERLVRFPRVSGWRSQKNREFLVFLFDSSPIHP